MKNTKKPKQPAFFVDAQKMHKKYPKTFAIPAKKELAKLKIGDLVKVATSGERFWTKITKINGGKIFAKVDNQLINTDSHGLELFDLINFEKKNIHSIY